MPEVEGAEIFEKILKSGMAAGLSAKEMADQLLFADDTMKGFARSTVYSTTAMSGLFEAMQKSRGIFNEFSSSVERSAIIMHAFGKAIGDVSTNLRGAVSSLEGFMSTMNTLGTKTVPDFTKNMIIAAKGYESNIEKLKESRSATEKDISENENRIQKLKSAIATMTEYGKKVDDNGYTLGYYTEMLKKHESNVISGRNEYAKSTIEIEKATLASKELNAALAIIGNWVTLIIAATVGVAMAYDTSLKAKREVIYTLGRMGVSYTTNLAAMEKFNDSFTAMSSKWGMLREDMAKVVAPLTGLGVGVGKGGAEASFKSGELGKTMTVVADWTGAMMRVGTEANVTSRAFGVLGTAMNLSGDALGDTFGKLAALGEKSVLSQQRYIADTISMLEITRKYGGAIEGAEIVTSAFGEGIKKGTYSMEAMARLVTPAMMTPEQKGGIIALMQQFAPEESKKLGITSENMFENFAAFERGAEDIKKGGNPELLAIGIIKGIRGATGGGGEDQQVFLLQQMLGKFGIQITTMEATKALMDPAKLATILKPPVTDTPAEIKEKANAMFTKTSTIAENTTSMAESLRNIVLNGGGFVRSEQTSLSVANAMLSPGIVNTMFGPFVAGFAQLIIDGLKKISGKATGGYISETAQYLLHAGEQVRRPGEGTGGDVNVHLGGMSVSIGDRGDMGSQINEAFDKIKRDTIEEIEKQWEQSLHAH